LTVFESTTSLEFTSDLGFGGLSHKSFIVFNHVLESVAIITFSHDDTELIFKPIMFATGALLTDDSLLYSLLFDEFNARNFVWKPINEIDNVDGQNRLFWPNLQ
jgi:hypothetical protein